MRFRDVLAQELAARQAQNPRYSLRRFARALGLHHSTLSRLLRSPAPLSPRALRPLAARLAIAASEVERYCLEEAELAVLLAAEDASLRKNSRALASKLGLPLDRINVCLQALLQKRELSMPSAHIWRVTATEAP